MTASGADSRIYLVHTVNKSMAVLQRLVQPDGDPAFHGSVHTATLAVCTVLVIFVVLMGTFGNGLVLLTAFQGSKRRSNVDVLVYNLAATDFIVCSCLAPTFLYLLFSHRQSTREFCGGLLFMSTACGVVSLLTLVAIAVYRLSIIYMVSLSTAVGATLHVSMSWTESHTTCQSVINSGHITTNNVVLFFISPVFAISFLIILVCYCIIARAVRVQTYLRVKALQPLLRSAMYKQIKPETSNYTYSSSNMAETAKTSKFGRTFLAKNEPLKQCSCCSCMAALEKENKAATMCFVVILIITLCWTPLVISHLIEVITGESITLYQVKLCGIALVFLNSALNPYMYAQNNGRMKQSYCRFFWDILRCQFWVPHPRRFETLVKNRRSRTLANAVATADYSASVQFIPEKPRRVFQTCDNSNVKKTAGMTDWTGQTGHRNYTNNVILYNNGGAGRKAASLVKDKGEVRQAKVAHAQNGKIADVRLLVQKTCCHVTSLDNQSLIES
ncbi:unnamed protein product [Candidula unifasciata]|uniref:G-protein coupled receptors family 1 profile domain-containing protein n=1 Tax=Candidula unifasciata TaxID=100452 RepID=A0A8S3ZWV8_9EUPU|nr:unnamed protein product [Candidula unifasciata]